MGVGYDNGRYALNSYKTIISGTATGLRISSVNGTAFLDNCPADILAAVGAQIKIYDSSSRYLQGVIDVAGSSEGLGGEKITGWTNVVTYPFDTFSSSGVDISSAINTAGTSERCVTNSISFSALGLYKNVIPFNLISGGGWDYFYSGYCLSNGSGFIMQFHLPTSATYTAYITQTDIIRAYLGLRSGNAVNFSISAPSIKQVTAPSANGVIIKDLSGNQNFISKAASFTYNAASYTYKIDTRQRIII